MKRNYALFLEDIIDSIEKIEQFVGDISLDEFEQDDKTSSAVVRKLEIIGEASKNIPAEIKQKHRDIPWSDMARIRDKVIHAYFGIHYEIVWKVVKERLPELKTKIKEVLRDLKEKPPTSPPQQTLLSNRPADNNPSKNAF